MTCRLIDQPQAPPQDQARSTWCATSPGGATQTGDDREIPVFFRVHPDTDPVDEVLHVGHWDEPIGDRHEIGGSTGLAELRPVFDERGRGTRSWLSTRCPSSYDLVLMGRADIQPADVVTFEVDELTGGQRTRLGARHGRSVGARRVGRRTGVGRRVGRAQPRPRLGVRDDAAVRAASRVRRPRSSAATRAPPTRSPDRSAPRGRAIEMRMWEVAEVSAQYATETDEDGRTIHPQRRTLMSGLEDSASPNRMVISPLRETPTPLRARPYITPFAWEGRPRHPALPGHAGRRPALPGPHPGGRDRRVPVGAAERAGSRDRRLVALPPGRRARARVGRRTSATCRTRSADLDGAHDLIDGQGRRAIHVDGLRITIGRDAMPQVGVRPDEPPPTALEITHQANNARIVIDDQGNIEIATDGDLTFRANKIEAHVNTTFEVL